MQSATRQARLTGLLPKAGEPYCEYFKGVAALKAATPIKNISVDYDFSEVKPEHLPEFIAESEAEYKRRCGWQRVFPCPEAPMRYLDCFETPRLSNLLLCSYYNQQAKKAKSRRLKSGRASASKLRPGTASAPSLVPSGPLT